MKNIVIETISKTYVEDKNGTLEFVISNGGSAKKHTFNVFDVIDDAWDFIYQNWEAEHGQRFDTYKDYQVYLAPRSFQESKQTIELNRMLPVLLAEPFNPDAEFATLVNEAEAPHKQYESSFMTRAAILTAADKLQDELQNIIFDQLSSDDVNVRRKGLIRSALLFHDPDDVATELDFAGIAIQDGTTKTPLELIKEAVRRNNLEEVEAPDSRLHYAGFVFTEEEVFDD